MFVSLSYLFVKHSGGSLGEGHQGGGGHTADYVILALLLAAMVYVFLKRARHSALAVRTKRSANAFDDSPRRATRDRPS